MTVAIIGVVAVANDISNAEEQSAVTITPSEALSKSEMTV
jgi:hypothetical protein